MHHLQWLHPWSQTSAMVQACQPPWRQGQGQQLRAQAQAQGLLGQVLVRKLALALALEQQVVLEEQEVGEEAQ